MSNLKHKIQDDMKSAMKSRQKDRLKTIRLILAEIKQQEISNKPKQEQASLELSDDIILTIINKMIKQRKDSIRQYQQANRPDLAQIEQEEIEVLLEYLPQQLNPDEVKQIILDTIASIEANSMQDMGKVMAALKQKLTGRADIAEVSSIVKQVLSSK